MNAPRSRASISVLAALALVWSLAGCARSFAAEDLMAEITPSEQQRDTTEFAVFPDDLREPESNATSLTEDPPANSTDPRDAQANALANFSVKLFQQCDPAKKSMLISPTSVLCAMGMTANGAAGATLAQMEDAFGMSCAELNAYARDAMASLPAEDACRVSLANSLWLKDVESFSAEPTFLQTNADWYEAGVFRAPFDASTVADINTWTSEHTDGMIPRIVDSLPPESVMCLVNALVFDARWLDEYGETQVWDDVFTTEEGAARTVDFMHSEEYGYLVDEGAVGFTKPYQGERYAFAALLPDEGISVADYAASLTGERLRDVLQNASTETVDVALPKFESDYSTSLNSALAALGITDAFNPDLADFSNMGSSTAGALYLGSAVHKTHIEVDEHGTKAAAATALLMEAASALPEEPKVVRLDRPFVYLIVDREQNLPLFIGTVMDIEG